MAYLKQHFDPSSMVCGIQLAGMSYSNAIQDRGILSSWLSLNQVFKEFETVWSEMVVPLMASRILEAWGAVSTSPEPKNRW
jgi:hypothetical protein